MPNLRTFTKRILIVTNLFFAMIFLLACGNAFLRPDRWWPISLLGLIFPWLLLILFGFLVLWLFTSAKRWSLISLVAMGIGWQNIHAVLAFHVATGFEQEKPSGALRVLTWNVRGWDQFITARPNASGHREKMLEFLAHQNADVMCFQEFYQSNNPRELPDNIAYIKNDLHYPYYFFSRDFRRYDGANEIGVIIFSRYPIVDSFQQKFRKANNIRATESLIAADINVNGQILRIFTTHLQSVLFRSKDFRNIEIIENADDSILTASRSIIKKLKRAYGFRCQQADQVRESLDSSSHSNILCGDFNDVPNSYTYFHIRGNMQDAFITKGIGIGRSYIHLSPTLRIDYILASPELEVLQCKRYDLPYSDHHPVIADFQRAPSGK
jgi:endonuclease/exonuclease/phosphatase family metal-dependent hydrolase